MNALSVYGPVEGIVYEREHETHVQVVWPRRGAFQDVKVWPEWVTGPFVSHVVPPAPPLNAVDVMLRHGLAQESASSPSIVLHGPTDHTRTAMREGPSRTSEIQWRRPRPRPFRAELHWTDSQGGRYWYCTGNTARTPTLPSTAPETLAALFALDMGISWMIRLSDDAYGAVDVDVDRYVAIGIDLMGVCIDVSANTWAMFSEPIRVQWIDLQSDLLTVTTLPGELKSEVKLTWLVMRPCRRVSVRMWTSMKKLDADSSLASQQVAAVSRLDRILHVLRRLNVLETGKAPLPSTLAEWIAMNEQWSFMTNMTDRLERLKQERADALSLSETLRAELEAARIALTDNQQRLLAMSDLQSKINALTASEASLQAQHVKLQQESADLRQKIQLKENDVIDAERNLAKRQAEATRLNNAMAKLRQQYDDALQREAKVKQEMVEVERKLQLAIASADTAQLDTWNAEKARLENERDAARGQVSSLSKDLAQVGADKAALEAQLSDALSQKAALEKNLADLSNQLAALGPELQNAKDARDALEKQLTMEQNQHVLATALWLNEKSVLERNMVLLTRQVDLLKGLDGKIRIRNARIQSFESAFPYVFTHVDAPLDDHVDMSMKRVSSPMDWMETLYSAEATASSLGALAPLTFHNLMPGFENWNLIVRIVAGIKSDATDLDLVVNAPADQDRIALLTAWHVKLSQRQTHTLWARGALFYGRTWRIIHKNRAWDGWLIWRSDPDDAYALGPSSESVVWGPGYSGGTPLPRVGYVDVFAEGPWKFDATCTFQLDKTVAIQTLEWELGDDRRIVLSTRHGGLLDQLWIMVRRP